MTSTAHSSPIAPPRSRPHRTDNLSTDLPLDEPRRAHGMQMMMLRWERLHPVNAVQMAHLSEPVSAEAVRAAASRVIRQLCGRGDIEFEHRTIPNAWHDELGHIVTDELNRPYDPTAVPFRVMLLETFSEGQFIALGYRHVIADARSVTLTLHEILHEIHSPHEPALRAARPVPAAIPDLFSDEFQLKRLPGYLRHAVREVVASMKSFVPPCRDPADLRMEFRIHDNELPLSIVKAASRRHDATINDVIFAGLLEWLARKFPPEARGRRRDLTVATLVDLCGRADPPLPHAFGQYLSQFAVRAPVTAATPFDEILKIVQHRTRETKETKSLIHFARGFQLLARVWDILPILRRPGALSTFIPLSAGISNVNVNAIVGDNPAIAGVKNYYRGTCVTNVLPMMFCITTSGETCTFTTTHRPTVFTASEIDDAVRHVCERLGSQRANTVISGPHAQQFARPIHHAETAR